MTGTRPATAPASNTMIMIILIMTTIKILINKEGIQ